MQAYIQTARHRQQERRLTLRQRQQHGFEIAQTAASILREHFGVSRIVLFGSILNEETVHESSDLDLAVWGLSPSDYLEAVARLMALPDFTIDLVPAGSASPHLQAAIAKGVPL